MIIGNKGTEMTNEQMPDDSGAPDAIDMRAAEFAAMEFIRACGKPPEWMQVYEMALQELKRQEELGFRQLPRRNRYERHGAVRDRLDSSIEDFIAKRELNNHVQASGQLILPF
jgi:hypothetical protein